MLVHILEAHQEENNFMAAKLEFIIHATTMNNFMELLNEIPHSSE